MQTEHLHSVHSNYIHIQHTCLSDKSEQYQKKKKDEKQKGSILPDKLILSTVLKKKYLPFFFFTLKFTVTLKKAEKGIIKISPKINPNTKVGQILVHLTMRYLDISSANMRKENGKQNQLRKNTVANSRTCYEQLPFPKKGTSLHPVYFSTIVNDFLQFCSTLLMLHSP